eukprot:CAMPEP_0198474680 /NCGR_PEP_ID=MMETSP1456-20131121/40434_1 /TAXON_ID=1461544 ORGANISM="Unidentified sp., Strain RCC1871" /NCGR_SAMPLE_ID=MMETSP1456 /ASSEMBLY_ACC=CAM_ASM_001119 /LENGTH=526 /DNA_ID=CAMNT_0044201377 /DNA_START=68 /DNA_END=1648 /DNA_ORIENTATION=-
MTLLFVSPVEGQACVVTAFPGETGSCPPVDPNDLEPLFCYGFANTCEPCYIVGAGVGVSDCDRLSSGPDGPDTVANCQRSCFDFYACTTNADCLPTEPFCNVPEGATEGQCGECDISALPGAAGSCPDIPVGQTGEKADVHSGLRRREQRHSRGEMRSEHNRGASLVAFLLAVSTMTLLFVSPVEGQGTPCTTNADCTTIDPFCNVPDGETEGVCGECVISAFPDEPGSCSDGDICGRQIDIRTGEPTGVNVCEPCSNFNFTDTDTPAACEVLVTDFSQEADVVANCQRECFAVYSCATNADCPDTLPICNAGQCEISVFSPTDGYACTTNADCTTTEPFCNVPDGETEGVCGECVVGAFPGENGSCPDIPVGQTGEGPQLCGRAIDTPAAVPICVGCAASEQEDGITSAEGCDLLAAPPFNQEADVVANCQRGCFEYYACTSDADCQDVPSPLAQACTSGVCTDIDECVSNADCPSDRPLCGSGQCLAECGTNADCPADRPICNAGQCEISVFSPLDGMGGGSSA